MPRMGSVAFIAGIVVVLVSTLFHASIEDLKNHPVLFAVYAQSDPWIAAHISEFAGVLLIFAGGFVALHRLLARSESGTTASALAWLGFAVTIVTASTFAILQAIDGIALKRVVDTWYAAPADSEEKLVAFRLAEGIRWTEIGINSMFRILQGTVGVIFGLAIAASAILSRWIGAVGVFAGVCGYTYCWCPCGLCGLFAKSGHFRTCLDGHMGRMAGNTRYFHVEKTIVKTLSS
jgi:hypothetical protein